MAGLDAARLRALADELEATREPFLREATRRLLADEVLHDWNGWSRAAIEFRQVPSGGDFTLVLAVPSSLPTTVVERR